MNDSNNPLKYIEREKLSEVIANQVIDYITNNALKVGDRLPTEKELIDKLGVSRTVIREGMQRLAIIGLIEIRTGRGTFVKEFKGTSKLILNLMSLNVKLKTDTLLKLIELREILEVGIVDIAARKRTKRDLKALEECLMQHEIEIKKYNQLSGQDALFHQLLVLSTHNDIIIDFYNGIFDLIKSSLFITGQGSNNRIIGLNDHKKIFEAIVNQDSKDAVESMTRHISWLKSIVKDKKKNPNNNVDSEK